MGHLTRMSSWAMAHRVDLLLGNGCAGYMLYFYLSELLLSY